MSATAARDQSSAQRLPAGETLTVAQPEEDAFVDSADHAHTRRS
ncbi:hypothetical protein [Streptomyces sp. NPDC002547]